MKIFSLQCLFVWYCCLICCIACYPKILGHVEHHCHVLVHDTCHFSAHVRKVADNTRGCDAFILMLNLKFVENNKEKFVFFCFFFVVDWPQIIITAATWCNACHVKLNAALGSGKKEKWKYLFALEKCIYWTENRIIATLGPIFYY